MLGLLQWFDLLERGKFSFYSALYRETADWSDWSSRAIPHDALRELASSVALAPFWGVDMKLPHLGFVGATDASSEFGIGGCTAGIGEVEVSKLARFAERAGAYVTLLVVESKPRSRSLGSPHNLRVGFDRFTAIFSIKATDDDHINLREARALHFYVRWVLRARNRHRHRFVVLVDSKVVVGAACKGRSGSLRLNEWLRRIFCLCFAGGLRMHVVFIPSEHNPADFPSRDAVIPGRRRAPPSPRCPLCRVAHYDHPLHVPRRRRGGEEPCRHRGCNGFSFVDGEWVSEGARVQDKLAWYHRRLALLRKAFRALYIGRWFSD